MYYLPDEEAVFIIEKKKDQLHVFDVIYSKPFDFEHVLSKFINSNEIKSVIYYFAPDQLNFKYEKVLPINDSPLFILDDLKVRTQPFKFPETAHT